MQITGSERAAGNFSQWLRDTEASLQSGNSQADVPCGACTACCRSAMFIHIRPHETRTIRRIPRALLFPAPGWPKGHLLMGYGDQGQCPMLVDNRCSIYEDRPQTCRDYDCRVFVATGVPVDPAQAGIAQRAAEWTFDFENEKARREQALLKAAATFLQNRRDLFLPGVLPNQPGPLAALAIAIHRLFDGEPAPPESAIVEAVIAALQKPRRRLNRPS